MSTDLLNDTIPGALSSQEIRQAIKEGWFGIEYSKEVEAKIQPASFDPTLSPDCHIVPVNWKPDKGATIRESLRRLSTRRRTHIDLTGGSQITPNPDFSYLVFLDGTFSLPPRFWLRSSPKSTEGRLGNLHQLVADGQTKYDEVDGPFTGKLAVKITPRVFSSIIYPGMSVNQLRLFCGHDFNYSEADLRRLAHKHELLWSDNGVVPTDDIDTRGGLELTLDLVGKKTDGLVGFRAIHNPIPIDRKLRRHHPIFKYFDAIVAPQSRKLRIPTDASLFILATHDRVRIPRDMAAEMTAIVVEHGGMKLHEAGFFDPGFGFGEAGEVEGKSAVLEIHATGKMGEELVHGQGCGRLIYHPTRLIPDKWYGMKELGSSYAQQIGAWLANPFKLPGDDLSELARILLKQREPIMAVSTDILFDDGKQYFQGFRTGSERELTELYREHGVFRPKEELEEDSLYKQPICYVVIVNPQTKKFFVYQRSLNPEAYSEERLRGKISIGVGGHVRKQDTKEDAGEINAIKHSRIRELEEEVSIDGKIERIDFAGLINYDGDPVSRVHFGLLYFCFVDTDNVAAKDAELHSSQMMTLEEYDKMAANDEYVVEAWTKIAADQVRKILK